MVSPIPISPLLKTSYKPDSVLTLLRNYGFTDTHISTFVNRRPTPLLANPIETLKPKLEFFNSIGLCGTELAQVLSNNRTLSAQSLENHIIPSIRFFKTILQTDTNLIKVLKRCTWHLDKDPQKHLAPKIALLRAHGVPDFNISYLLMAQPRTFLQTTAERFVESVKHVREMRFDHLKAPTVEAICVLASTTKSVWEGKMDVYKSWGWSEAAVHMAFMRQPRCMMTSEKKIMHIMDVLVNKMGYQVPLIAQQPVLLMFSLEKRIVPRCSVLHILRLNGLVEKDCSLTTALKNSEEYFLTNYVTKF